MKYDVIVVGSGVSGLTSALKLAKSGKKVAIFEKHFIPGGYATNFSRKGKDGNTYTFDVSLHSLSGLNKNCTVYNLLDDLDIINDITLLEKSDPTIVIRNEKTFYIPNNINEYQEYLINLYPNFKSGIISLFNFVKDLYQNMIDMSLFKDTPKYQSMLEKMSLYDFIKSYVDNEEFIENFCHLWVYNGLPPKKLVASYAMDMISSFIVGGNNYIKGGSGTLTKIMKESIEKHGSDIYLLSEITKINTKNNTIVSVTTKKGETFKADEFIFACDPTHIFSLTDSTIAKDYVKNLNVLEKSNSLTQMYIGINCSTEEIGIDASHMFFYNTNSDDIYNSFKNGTISNSNFVLTSYDKMDSALNSHGAVFTVTILEYSENWPERNTEEYKQKKENTIELFLNKLIKLYPKLKDHIQVVELGTPRTMSRYTNNSNGSVYGWAQTLEQGGFKRTSFKTPFDNAIVVGAWSYPGGGYEGSIFSGMIGANRILSKNKISETNSSNDLISIDQLLDGLIRKFNPENAEEINITYKFLFEGHDPIYLEIKNKTARLLPKSETPEKVDTILSMSHETWYKICFNKISGQDALMDGLVTCEGNLRNFASLPKIFNKSL